MHKVLKELLQLVHRPSGISHHRWCASSASTTRAHKGVKKVKLSLFMPWRYTGGAEAQLHPLLTLALNWKWMVNIMPYLIFSQQRIPVCTEEEARRAPEPVWELWRRQKPLAPARIRTSHRPSHNPVPTRSMLFWLCQSIQWSKSGIMRVIPM